MQHDIKVERYPEGFIAYCDECQRDGIYRPRATGAKESFIREFPECERPRSTPQDDLLAERFPY